MLLPAVPCAKPANPSTAIRWIEVRCLRCRRLLQKMEEHALRPGKRIEVKCSHCKTMNYSIGSP